MQFHKEMAVLKSHPESVAVRPTTLSRTERGVCVGCTALYIKEQLTDVKAFTILNTADAAAAEVVK